MLAETLALVASRPAAHSQHIPSVALDFLAVSALRAIVIHVPMGWRSALNAGVPVSGGVVKRT